MSFISIAEHFFGRRGGRGGGGNSLKQTYVEGWGVHVKQTGMKKGGRGFKNWKFRANVLFE